MSKHPEFHSIERSSEGAIVCQLAEGFIAHIFPGDQAMLSIVTVDANAEGSLHQHPEEQWGFCIEGNGIRVQGTEEVPFTKGDFWRTPSHVPHTLKAGPKGCRVLDIFAPPRAEYRQSGTGFGVD